MYFSAVMNLVISMILVKVNSPDEIKAQALIMYSYLPG